MQAQLRPCHCSRPLPHGVPSVSACSKGLGHISNGTSGSLRLCAAADSAKTPGSPNTVAQLQQQKHQQDPALLIKQATATAASGAVLGPLCDGLHSKADVLHYVAPIHIHVGSWQLETCWWVPALFGLAGVILGLGYPLLDTLASTGTKGSSSSSSIGSSSDDSGSSSGEAVEVARPGWLTVLLVISLFISQYWLSGQLTTGASSSTAQLLSQLPPQLPAVDLLLAAYGWAVWRVSDGAGSGAQVVWRCSCDHLLSVSAAHSGAAQACNMHPSLAPVVQVL